MTPYATVAVAKKGRRHGESANQEDYELETGEDLPAVEESEHSGDEDVTTDSMIKVSLTVSFLNPSYVLCCQDFLLFSIMLELYMGTKTFCLASCAQDH